MERLLRWLAILLGSLVGLLIVGYGVLYLLSERKLDQTYPVPAVLLSAPTDAESGESNPKFTAPDLRAVGAYSPQAFDKLMRTGVSLGGRDINIMKHLSLLTDAEVAAIYGYLHALGAPS